MALSALFVQVLKLCQRAGLVKLGHVALDGIKIKANASKHKAMSYERIAAGARLVVICNPRSMAGSRRRRRRMPRRTRRSGPTAAHGYLGHALAVDGRSDQAIDHIEQAIRMSPHDPQNCVL